MEDLISSIILFFRRHGFGKCPHTWHPCLYHKKPARICFICDKVEELTLAEFYAYFGRVPNAPFF